MLLPGPGIAPPVGAPPAAAQCPFPGAPPADRPAPPIGTSLLLGSGACASRISNADLDGGGGHRT
ncbi:hypothetical protein U9M48_044000 [Paspalum notatum var. saurae]|uniref:Uncharacterized protein n=1 Tax=Paspalum notatum var. saurae TaxID=547442 RepID=A0AAQ3UW28_PASNO